MSTLFDPEDSDNTKLAYSMSTDACSLAATVESLSSGIVAQPAVPNPAASLQIDMGSTSHITSLEIVGHIPDNCHSARNHG